MDNVKKYIIDNKDLMSEWDSESNSNLNPEKLLLGSNKKAWWVCSYCGYRWQTSIYHRAIKGTSCPSCYHKKRKDVENNLVITHPEIALDWHPTKNLKLSPTMYSKNSRYKAWWKCHLCGKEIEKEIKIYKGCTVCKKKSILNERNLSITHKDLLLEWDYDKNKTILPTDVLASNPKKVWWKCKKCGHEWQAKINNRAILGRGCPCCSNRKVVIGINDLATTHPEIAKEWHPTKNGDLTPQKITHGSGKKVWWLCPLGHEYQATVLHRTQKNGTNCPICYSGRQTSFAEQAVYYYVKKLYPDAVNRYTADFLGRMELDIYIPSIRYAIEYDGEAWHKKEKIKREQKKYKICKENNIKLIRLREKMPDLGSDIADYQWSTTNLYEHHKLEDIVKELLKRINFSSTWMLGYPIDVNIERDKYEILKYKTNIKNNTLLTEYPDIAKQWHPTKNGDLTPSMFMPRSDHKVWWLCPVCGYEYEATIGHRTASKKPTGCPKCAIKKVTQINSKTVNMIDPKTNTIVKTFSSISEAGRTLHINSSNITSVCKGQRNFAGGYKWKYADEG